MIKIIKHDFGKSLTISIGKYSFVIGYVNLELMGTLLNAHGSLDNLAEHQHKKHCHDTENNGSNANLQ